MRGKSLFLLFLFLAIASVLLGLAFQHRGKDDKWETSLKQIDAARAEAKASTLPHSKIQGDLTPGNAWEEYDLAIKDTANALQHLQAGARRTNGQYPYKWDRGHRLQYPDLPAIQGLSSFATKQARALADKGQSQEAANLLIDLMVLGRDLATNSPLRSRFAGQGVYAAALNEMRHLLLSGKLSQAQLIELERKLEIVARDFPPASDSFAKDMLLVDMQIREIAEGTLADAEWRAFVLDGYWGLAFSPKVTSLRAIAEKQGILRRFEKLDNADFPTAWKELEAIEQQVFWSKDKLVSMGVPSVKRVFISHHNVLTRILLLQAAAGFLATNHMPTVRDPFGDKLLFEQKDGKTKIWSRGPNGTNQNGRGEWLKDEPDVVLDLTQIPKE